MNVPALSSYVRRKDMDSVLNCIVSDNLAPGEYVERLTKAVREKLGFDHCVALRSPMGALALGLELHGLRPGDAVGVSALSDAWVGRLLEQRGLTPVWLDVDPIGAMPDAAALERLASGGAKALYLHEPWGLMPEPSLVTELGIPVIEDATSSLGASSGGAAAGSLGSYAIIGLEHAAALTGGGGALLAAVGRREAQVLRNGAERLVAEELLPDMNAALALSQLKDLERFRERRRELAELYAQSLARAHKRALSQAGEGEGSYFGCVVVLETGVKDVRAYAKKKEVGTAMAFERSCVAAGYVPEGLCPQAASLANRAVAFPLHPRIGGQAAQRVAKVLATLP